MRSSESTIQDGGILGWFGVLGTFASWFAWLGTVKCLAVLLPTLQDQFNTDTWLVGWVIAIFDGCIDLTGPIAPAVKRRFGIRLVVMVSGLLVGMSLVLSSFASSLVQMTCILAFCTAPAVGVCNIALRELVGECFPNSHTRAFAIGAMGASVSFVVFPPLTQFFMDVYGWRGALMLNGSILLHLAVCGALLRTHPVTNQRNGDYEMVTNTSSDDKTIREKFRSLSVLTSIKNAVNIDLFALSGYWLVVLISIFTTVAATTWFVYFAAHTNQYKGFSLSDVVAFVSVFGVGKILGNLAVAFIGGYQFIGTNLLMGLAVTVSSACFLTDLMLESYWPIMAYVFVYGFFQSFIYTLLDVMTKETVGVERLGSALGWIGMKCGFVRALFLFLPGLIYDTLGSYTVAFILMAFLNALALPALLVLTKLQRRN